MKQQEAENRMTMYDILIVGAGPTGLACALAARDAGLSHIVLDKGTLVNTIVGYPTMMTFFSTPERLELGSMPFTSPNVRPTRVEAIEYYRGVARKGELNLSLHNAVLDAAPHPEGGFLVRAERGEYRARRLVIATGYFDNTNRLNVPGEELPKMSHYYREAFGHYDQDVLVVGGRNSAVEAALDLYRHGARVTMIHRRDQFGSGLKYWVRPDIDNRLASGEITMYWNTELEEVRPGSVLLRSNGDGSRREIPNDFIYALIGYRPDVRLLDACGVRYDPETLIPEYDPATFETNIPDLFIAGSVACGCKTWEIFIENGREHAGIIVREIAGRVSR